ncbi:hypothetical protein D3C71_1629390 [compost metagenome]
MNVDAVEPVQLIAQHILLAGQRKHGPSLAVLMVFGEDLRHLLAQLAVPGRRACVNSARRRPLRKTVAEAPNRADANSGERLQLFAEPVNVVVHRALHRIFQRPDAFQQLLPAEGAAFAPVQEFQQRELLGQQLH